MHDIKLSQESGTATAANVR